MAKYETPDPKPKNLKIGFKKPPTLAEQVARLVNGEHLKRYAQQQGDETFEEANDFGPEEMDPLLRSPYEEREHGDFEEEVLLEKKHRAKAAKELKDKREAVEKASRKERQLDAPEKPAKGVKPPPNDEEEE